MKKFLAFLLFAAVLFGAASCGNEEISSSVADGDQVEVTFTANLPELGTRAYGDGTNANIIYVNVYEAGSNILLSDLTLDGGYPVSNKQAKVNIALIKGMQYDIVFWAQNANCDYYTLDGKVVTVDYENATANDNSRDAFYAYVEGFNPVAPNGKDQVKLYRPFAQLNAATNDKTAVVNSGVNFLTRSEVKTYTYTQFNIANGNVAGNLVEVSFSPTTIPASLETPEALLGKEGYTYLSMNYLLVNRKELVNATFKFYGKRTEGDTEFLLAENEYSNIPLQRNYRTNILGSLLTKSTEFEVEILPGFGGESTIQNVYVDGVSYDTFAEAVAAALENNKSVCFVEDITIDADETITVPADKTLTLELNGCTLKGVTDQPSQDYTGSITSANNRAMFDVRGTMNVKNGTVTLKHNGKNLDWNGCTDVFYVAGNGTLNVEDATIENLGGSDMAFGIDLVNAATTRAADAGITLNVNNSTLKSSYIPVRVFNNGAGMNNVTIKNSTLEGTSRAFWVHIYSNADNGGKGVKSATLNIDIYNNNNTFIANNPDRIIEYGFTDEVNFREDGTQPIKDAEGNEVEGIGLDANGNYAVTAVAGLEWISSQVISGDNFTGKTIKLLTDIDFGDTTFYPIGYNPTTNTVTDFEGTFDGNGKTIKNLKRTDLTYANKRAIGLFSRVNNAVVKNFALEEFVAATYGGEAAAVTCVATGDCLFEDINLKSGSVVAYNNDTAGIVGWANVGNFTFKNITIGSDVTIYSLWDSYDTSLGGVVGTLESPSTVTMENINISCVISAFNDVCANYQWYAYRRTGMIIGNMDVTQTIDGRELPDPAAAGVTCKNVTVTYGDWMNYHYCEFESNGAPSYADEGDWKFSRVEGSEWGRESDIDTENCAHDTDESHNILLPVDQLFGGGQGVYGLREYTGVTVNYPASYRREVSSAEALTEALNKGVSVILDEDVDFGSTQLAITGENQVVDLGGHTLTTANNWGGISLKNGASIKNGTITHAGNTAAIKAFSGSSVENVTINATCTTADKTVTGIAVQQGATVESIKNVTINGVSQGIEVGYQATVGLIEKAVVNESNNGTAKGIALVINGGKVGKAKDCNFKGETYGITMHLKGVFAVGLELENCKVEGTTASIYAWDEKGISNTSGSLSLSYDAATTLTGPFVWDFEEECQSVVTLNRPQ